MRRRASTCGPLRSGLACLVLLTVTASLDRPAQAECILQPKEHPPEGAHWSIHLDRAKNRRCWVLVDAQGRDFTAPPEQAAPSFSFSLSSVQSFFNNIVGGPPPMADPPSEQETPAAAAPGAAPPHPPASRVAAAARPAVRTERKGTASHDMTPEERDALFEEFLRWHESQQVTGATKEPQ